MVPRRPPMLADRFLHWFCRGELLEEIQGDLHEYYLRHTEARFPLRGYLHYWFHVFQFVRPFAVKKFFGQNLIYTHMFRSNIIITLRNLSKHKFYTGLNILGLALGFSCCLFIATWILDELSYDTFFENHERIYRVSSDLMFQDNKFHMALSPAPMAEAFKSDFPEIEASGRMRRTGTSVFRKGDRFLDQNNIFYADHEVFDIFSFVFVHGDKENALEEPNTVVITETVAAKYFDEENPIGKSLVSSADVQYKIDAVIKDIPYNSHFNPEMFITMEDDQGSKNGVWLSNNYYTYFLLDENNDPGTLAAKFESVYEKYFGPQLEQFVGATWEQMLTSGSYVNYYLIALNDIHLKSSLDLEISPNGDIQYVYIFGSIGVFILLIACINFMNISTARAAVRGKEVGVRKVLGSVRGQLVTQFLTESVIYSLMAFLVAVGMVYLLLPMFRNLTGKMTIDPFAIGTEYWIYVILCVLLVGLLAGLYPSFVLSGFKPVAVLKGQLKSGKSGALVRSVLVVFQFAMSVILIVGTGVVYSQLQFVQNKNLGFDKDGVLILNNTFTMGSKITSFKQALLDNPRIESVTVTGYLPTNVWRSDSPLQPEEATNTEGAVGCQIWTVDYDYIEAMGMKIIAGRDFSEDLVSDSTAVILNETAAKRFGFDNIVGRKLKTLGEFQLNGRSRVTVIGVIQDFHFDSMRDNIDPMVIFLGSATQVMAMRFGTNDVKAVVGDVEDLWNEFNPNYPLDYDFMDRQFAAKYEAETKLGTIFSVFGVFAVIIACLGLFGLSAFTAEQRKKEIGIRKVLGASVSNLVGLLFSGYTKLLVVSLIVGLPVAFLMMDDWLNDFAYHTEIGAGVLIMSALVSLIVAWLTVSYQSMRAARLNPVENLRNE